MTTYKAIKVGEWWHVVASDGRTVRRGLTQKEAEAAARRMNPPVERPASREEQHGTYLDAGPQNWDDESRP